MRRNGMTRTTTRVTVARTTLIDRLAKAKALTIDRARKKQERYDAEVEDFNVVLSDALSDLAARVLNMTPEKALDLLGTRYSGGRNTHTIQVKVKRPEKPSSPACEVNKIEKMLRVLEASTDAELTIRADDEYAEYL
jgi:hypothetical protein